MPFPHHAPPSTSSHLHTMTSAEKSPLLHLSDIMHHMSPSPVPAEQERERSGSATPRGASPEPVSETEALGIRRRLQEMGLWRPAATDNLSSREKELVDMITRLVDPLPIDPAQLSRQAETIAALIAQRDYVLRQAADDRERWKYERETWDRTAEALLTQKASAPTKVEETNTRERQIHDMEMRSLENKLAEARRRQTALESELRTLKPLLFIQPYFIPRQDKGKGKAREFPTSNPINPEITVKSVPVASSSKLPYPNAYQTSSQGHHHRGQTTHRSSNPISKRPANPKKGHSTPLSADAYSEHLLLAMRRVGRTRAAEVSGIIGYAERANGRMVREQERRVERDNGKGRGKGRLLPNGVASGGGASADYYRDADAGPADMDHDGSGAGADFGPGRRPPSIPPRTPVKSTVIHYGPRTTRDNQVNTPIVFVHTNTPTPASTSLATVTPTADSNRHPQPRAGSPRLQYTPLAPPPPPTPLDSLIDAARSMMGSGKGKARARDDDDGGGGEPESPLPSGVGSKRRKLLSADRPRSALDVLADQAAAAFDFNDLNEPGHGQAGRRRHGHDRDEEGESEVETEVEGEMGRDEAGDAEEPRTVPRRGRGRGRPRGSVSSRTRRDASVSGSASTTSTTTTTAATTSASGRPIRQSRRVEAAQEHELEQAPSSGAAGPSGRGRGTGRPRGRPRGSTNASRGRTSAGVSASRVIAPSSGGEKPTSRGRDQDGGGEEERVPTKKAPSSSIASEVLRHGFADATRFRLSATSSGAPEQSNLAANPRLSVQDTEDVEMLHVPTHADAAAIIISPDASLSPPVLSTAVRPVQSWRGPPGSAAVSSGALEGLPTILPPPLLLLQESRTLDPQSVAAHSPIVMDVHVHPTPQPPHPDADNRASSRADKMDADRALGAEAEARHNLPRGVSQQQQQAPSDPPFTPYHAGHGTANGASGGLSHDGGDANGEEQDADAEGEMEVE
ncbi:hypothetical protein D9619_000134 [Psilocybe cf. subviscida]|uniref:Uncharacterized protein n=1 Tax=Psilocybe cf. subviscida TaxID=2480587 RepID=A0A8H5F249_9AGAR|nr:hypothetical protein D9619_000134 [Psilocybe cf. subviscida]